MIKQHIPKDKEQTNENWITNLTKTIIPNHIKYILSLGPKFSVNETPKPNFLENIITNIESGIEHLENNDREIIRNKIFLLIIKIN